MNHLHFNTQKRAHDCYKVVFLRKYTVLVLLKINLKAISKEIGTWAVGRIKSNIFHCMFTKKIRVCKDYSKASAINICQVVY